MTPCLFTNFFFGKKGRASFHYDDDDDDDEMMPSKSWAKIAATLKLFTHEHFILKLHIHMVVKVIPVTGF